MTRAMTIYNVGLINVRTNAVERRRVDATDADEAVEIALRGARWLNPDAELIQPFGCQPDDG